ncbi:ATP-binding protein [Mesobacillus thioparans]
MTMTRVDNDSINISFMDQGCGISNERLSHIGEPYYSLKEKGTGMGLMVCHKIIQVHGGRMEIKSMINQGTTVSVILPIS